MSAPLPIIPTRQLLLRPRTLADLEFCVAMDREPGTLRWIDWEGEDGGSWEDERAHRAFVRSRIEARYPEGMGYWMILPREVREPAGWVLLIPEGGTGPEAEIGWRLVRAARGRGYATEAAHAICRHAFGTLGLKRLVADMYRANTASMNVARRLGMTPAEDPERTNDRFVLWELTAPPDPAAGR